MIISLVSVSYENRLNSIHQIKSSPSTVFTNEGTLFVRLRPLLPM